MPKKIWVNDRQFVEVADKKALGKELATRERAWNLTSWGLILPDPDPVLRKKGQDITIYRELLTDAHVDSTVQSRMSGVTANEWDIEEGESSRKARRAADWAREFFEGFDMEAIQEEMLEAVLLGFAPLEVIWEKAEGRWIPATLKGKPQEWFGFDQENNLRFLTKENMVEGELLPPYKFLLVRSRASYQNPYGQRVLSRCFWPVAFKKGGLKFWVAFTEKYGMPWVIGKHPRGAPDSERNDLLDGMEEMVQDGVAVIPDDSSVEIISDASRGASAELYERLVDVCNAEISKAVLGQTLTTEMSSKGGAYAASETHMEVRGDLVERDKKLVAGAFNRLIDWACDLNFPDVVRPFFRWQEEEALQTERAERDKALAEQGVRFGKKYYSRIYNIPEEEFEVDQAAAGDDGQAAGRPAGEPPADALPVTSKEAEAGAEFAAGGDCWTPEQQAIEELVDTSASAADLILQKIVEAILREAEAADSLEELAERVLVLYPELDVTELAELLGNARFSAETWGRLAVSGQVPAGGGAGGGA